MADKTGYIGRNPNDSAVTVARQFFTASGVTTTFTFASGYLTGYLDVYVDGVKRRVADEFTATDGSTFDVLQGGVSAGSTVEAVAYKAFNAAAISGDITGNFDVSGNTTLGGSLSVTGGTTLSNINVTGIATLGAGTTVAFANTAFNLSGTPDITVDLLNAVDINVSGAATIGGILTYEDVTNIDSVGIVTARTGVEVTANGLVVNAGVSTFAADVSIADKIVHTGDTNTAIRFPSADTITAETAGVERLRIDSSGDVGLVGIATATGLVVVAGSGIYAGHAGVVTAVTFDGNLTGSVTGAATQVTVADESSDTTCFPLFVTAATGDLAPKSGTNLAFNSSSGRLDATQFNGNFVGGTVSGTTGTFSSDVDIADKIVHTGDTNTAIRFPAGDTFSIETGAVEALRVDSSQRLLIGPTSTRSTHGGGNARLQVEGTNTETAGVSITRTSADAGSPTFSFGKTRNGSALSDGDDVGVIYWQGDDGTDLHTALCSIKGEVDGSVSGNAVPGRITFNTATTSTNLTERLRITSTGLIGINTTPGTLLELKGESSKEAEITFNRQPVQGTNDGVIGQLLFENNTDSVAQISVKRESAADDAYIQFANQATSGGVTEKLRITSAGLVSIKSDTGKFTAGTDSEMQVFHDGTDSLIKDTRNSGSVKIQADNFSVIDKDASETMLSAVVDGAVTLNHDGSARVTTTADGVDISGTGSIKVPVGTTAQRNASPTAGDFRYNSTTGGFEGYTTEWGAIAGSGGGASESDTSVSSTSATSIYTTAHATNRSVSAIIQITQGTSYQVGRYLVIHDGTTATIIEESAVATGDMLGTFTADINGSNLRILVNMSSASSATVTILPTVVTV